MTQQPFNAYVGIVAQTEEDARKICAEQFHTEALELVHKEEGVDEEESPTWIFTIWADSGVEPDDEGYEALHDFYDLPSWPNYSYEEV